MVLPKHYFPITFPFSQSIYLLTHLGLVRIPPEKQPEGDIYIYIRDFLEGNSLCDYIGKLGESEIWKQPWGRTGWDSQAWAKAEWMKEWMNEWMN